MSAEHSNVLIVGNGERADAVAVAARAVAWLRAHGHHVCAEAGDISSLSLTGVDTLADQVLRLVISIGGDGTMLRAVGLLDGTSVPVLGVNVGQLGYLAEVEPTHLEASLEKFFSGVAQIEERLVLDVTAHTTAGVRTWRALNEASLEKLRAGQTVRLRLSIDSAVFTTYQADGVIVATPTGSTAYAMSARGPVVSPSHQAILITPLAPHMLFDRSLVLRSDEVVEVEVVGNRAVGLTVDGQEVATLQSGERVSCSTSSRPALFVRVQPRRFHQTLKSKFGLADR